MCFITCMCSFRKYCWQKMLTHAWSTHQATDVVFLLTRARHWVRPGSCSFTPRLLTQRPWSASMPSPTRRRTCVHPRVASSCASRGLALRCMHGFLVVPLWPARLCVPVPDRGCVRVLLWCLWPSRPPGGSLTKFLVEEKGFNPERVARGIEKLKKARGGCAWRSQCLCPRHHGPAVLLLCNVPVPVYPACGCAGGGSQRRMDSFFSAAPVSAPLSPTGLALGQMLPPLLTTLLSLSSPSCVCPRPLVPVHGRRQRVPVVAALRGPAAPSPRRVRVQLGLQRRRARQTQRPAPPRSSRSSGHGA